MTEKRACCFTGHRVLPKDKENILQEKLEAMIETLIEKGVTMFNCGGARGFDTVAALTVIKLRRKHEHIRLHLEIPCLNQTKGWSDEDIHKYNFVMQNSDTMKTKLAGYETGCMHERNRALVDGSDLCIAFLTKNSGGTFYTVNYAKEKKLEIINLAELI